MARGLTSTLDQIMTVGELRRPSFTVEIFDIRSTSQAPTPTRINDVVLFNLGSIAILPAIVGPRDFSDDVLSVGVTEVAGDYASQGIAATSITVQVSDPGAFLDPVESPAPDDGRWLRQGNVIVIREGDLSAPVGSWPITFTGAIQGQPGQDFNRTTGNAVLSAKASSREVDFLRRLNTSRNFNQGETFQDIAEEIAEVDMGLDLDEVNLGTFSTRFTQFKSTQFVEESALTTIAKIMFVDGFMPRFGGDGRLTQTSGQISKGPARVYAGSELPITVLRPILEFNGTNEVEILGLDPNLTKVKQERQELASAGITTGFFSHEAQIPVRWSEDKTQQAENVLFEVLSSIGDSPFAFGSEDFVETLQTDGGSVEGEISVDGAIFGGIALVGLVVVAWLISLAILDIAPTTGGPVIPTGRTVTVLAGQAIMFILGQEGRGEYRMLGEPYEYVFKEIRSVARISGIRSEDRQSISIENHLINSEADCDDVAERTLRRERSKQNLRSIRMVYDVKLEPDDVFAIGSGLDERRYMIQSISRVLSRSGDGTATLNCFEVTAGVRP